MRLICFCAISSALLLAGCGSQDQAAGNASESAEAGNQLPSNEVQVEKPDEGRLQPVDDSARAGQPSLNPDSEHMEWSFSSTAGGPRLVYGEPQTDNVRLMLRCLEGGSVLVSFVRPDEFAEGKPDMLSLSSGNSRRSLLIETQQGPLGTSVEAEAPLSAGPLEQFRSGSALEVHWGEATIAVPAAQQEPLGQFFEACG